MARRERSMAHTLTTSSGRLICVVINRIDDCVLAVLLLLEHELFKRGFQEYSSPVIQLRTVDPHFWSLFNFYDFVLLFFKFPFLISSRTLNFRFLFFYS